MCQALSSKRWLFPAGGPYSHENVSQAVLTWPPFSEHVHSVPSLLHSELILEATPWSFDLGPGTLMALTNGGWLTESPWGQLLTWRCLPSSQHPRAPSLPPRHSPAIKASLSRESTKCILRVFQSEFHGTLALTVIDLFIILKPLCPVQISSWSSRLISELSVYLFTSLNTSLTHFISTLPSPASSSCIQNHPPGHSTGDFWSTGSQRKLCFRLIWELWKILTSKDIYLQPVSVFFNSLAWFRCSAKVENHCSESLLLKQGPGTSSIDIWGGLLAKAAAMILPGLYAPLCKVCRSSQQEVESISLSPESGLDWLWLMDCGGMTLWDFWA